MEITIRGPFPFKYKQSNDDCSVTVEDDGSVTEEGVKETIVFNKKPYTGGAKPINGKPIHIDGIIGPVIEVDGKLYKWAIEGNVPEDAKIADSWPYYETSTATF
jgi:hypothetical protein